MRNKHYMVAAAIAMVTYHHQAFAQALPGNAESERIGEREQQKLPPSGLQPTARPQAVQPAIAAPEQSKDIRLTLHRVTIEGAHALPADELRTVYQDYLDREISLDVAWLIAEKLTNFYHEKGYFLSRAYIPKQSIANGELRVGVVEGYIAEVVIDDTLVQDAPVLQEWVDRIKAFRPISSEYLESVLLQMNDVPGISLHATLEPVTPGSAPEGAVRMLLAQKNEPNYGQVKYENIGSKYLGPYQASVSYHANLIPGQKTSLYYLATTPFNELKYGTLRQRIPVFPGGYAELYGGYTYAEPGYSLRTSEIKSKSLSTGASLDYHWIRQRQENLSTKIAFDLRNTQSDILGITPLTRDRIRVLRASMNYEAVDRWQGYNQMEVTLSEGLGILNASKRNGDNLSRASAQPWFQKGEFNVSRSQMLDNEWYLITAASGQIASGPLYSSEEFGYGGQSFGRAYDSSEIVGDHGISASVELRYNGLGQIDEGVTAVPYGFYDGGAVFNEESTQDRSQSGMSTGLGVRVDTSLGLGANMAVALPVGLGASAPTYGGSGHNPRYVVELSYKF